MGLLQSFEKFLDDRINKVSSAAETRAQSTYEDLQKRSFETPDGKIERGRRGLIIDPFFGQETGAGSIRPKRGSLSNLILKMAARQNVCASTIIHTRATEVMACCTPQRTQYELGYKIQAKEEGVLEDPKEIAAIKEYINNCGNKEQRAEQDKLTFGQFGYMVTVDALKYGHFAIERDLFADGSMNAFLPLPAETIFYAATGIPEEAVKKEVESWEQFRAAGDKQFQPVKEEDQDNDNPIEYVQWFNGKTTATFTRKELIFSRLTPDNDIDLNGYAISPLERAITMVANHLKIENHQAMFFTHGMASRGILVIQGDVTPNQMRTLQAQWKEQTTGGANSWRTPVLGGAGVKNVQWIPLVGSTRDMEYAAYQDHVLRTIHAAFAIDPEQTGYGYLSRGTEQRSLAESSNEWKVSASRERGLRPILTRIEEVMNEEVLPAANPEWAAKYRFVFAGLDAETRTEETQRLTGDVQLHTTVNEARVQAGKNPLPIGGNFILNPVWLQTIKEGMPFGMFCEMFLGLEGASRRPDLNFFCNPFWFQWQQLQMQMAAMQAGIDLGGKGEKTDKKDEMAKTEDGAVRMQQAISDFMSANPAMFKHYSENLAKSKAVQRMINPITKLAMKNYKIAGDRLVEDVLKIVQEDLNEDRGKKE